MWPDEQDHCNRAGEFAQSDTNEPPGGKCGKVRDSEIQITY